VKDSSKPSKISSLNSSPFPETIDRFKTGRYLIRQVATEDPPLPSIDVALMVDW
jgi:hypothetical protein